MLDRILRRRSPREVFEHIYDTDHWRGGSGAGSTVAASQAYREILTGLIAELGIVSIVDVGCGDWRWAELMDWSQVSYTGVDVVPSLIERNRTKHGSPHVQFRCIDTARMPPPSADLITAKDVLQHWPNRTIRRFLRDTLRRCRYALLTNDVSSVHWPGDVNQDIAMGAWRTLDLSRPPFTLRPLRTWDYDIDGGVWVKRVCLVAGSVRR